MRSRRVWLLLLVAGLLRLVVQGWDSSLLSPHPDERQVAFVAERLHGWLADPGFYAYGSLHLQLVRLASWMSGAGGHYRGLLIGGRALSLVASLIALLLGAWVARRAWGRRASWLVLLLGAWVPLDLQQSHFATVEADHAAWVMAALAGSFWLATGGGALAAAVAGAAAGASLAVKVASLPLALPLAVALVLAARRRGALEAARLAAVASGSALAAFWLAQPWAFRGAAPPLPALAAFAAAAVALTTARAAAGARRRAVAGLGLAALGGGVAAAALAHLNPAYLAGVGEQVAMVLGRSDLAYVRVYHGTLPVLYPARELTLWGLGPLLAAAAAVAGGLALWRLAGRWRHLVGGRVSIGDTALLVLLAWLVPMAGRLATLQVKYLRYWEPLVVPAVMVAAWALDRAARRGRLAPVRAVVAGTVVWGVMYLSAFLDPHPHRTAAEWLRMTVQAGQTVAFEHWDETLDLGSSAVQKVELPSYDLPDDGAKAERWCDALRQADWVVLTSNRVRRTVLANPERFPLTGRLYRLLLAGEAGFTPLTRVDRGPHLLGIQLPVQLADESFVNYDFPRVVVLRRTGQVDPAALLERVGRPLPRLEGLGPAGVERRFVDPLPRLPAVPGGVRQVADVVLWAALFTLSGVALWALALPVLRAWPDAGLGLALTTGWILPAWLLWFGSEAGLWPVGAATAMWLELALVAAGGAALWRRRVLAVRLVRSRGAAMSAVLLVAAAVWLAFLVIRAGNPAIHWGEKPMDFSFLNAFLNARSWPPGEPWLAGLPLYYYYGGEILASWPILLAGVHPSVGYNLMAAAVPALAAAPLAALGLLVARRRRVAAAWLLPVLVVLTGNLAWPWLLDLARSGRWFDLWWATSRVVPGFAIDEYPLWTALFADLHAHFLALPVALVAALWGWAVIHTGRGWPLAAAACGLAVGVLATTNPWDILVVTAALAVGVAVAGADPGRGIARLAAAAVVSLVVASPWVAEMAHGVGRGVGGRGLFLTGADFAPWWSVLRHFGVFVIPLAVLAVASLRRVALAAVPLALLGVGAGVVLGSGAAAVALGLVALFLPHAAVADRRLDRLAWALAALGVTLVAATERFTLVDRMNTLFKVYNGVWWLLAGALGILLLSSRGWRRSLLLAVWLPLEAVALVNLPLGVAQGLRQPRMPSPVPTLNGQAFLPLRDPDTWFAVRVLQGVARPGDTVAEAAGASYAAYTRIAMHTGLATVVGWEYHLEQRGQSLAEIQARRRDLETLYSDRDPRLRRAVLDRYGVRWVVVGPLERTTYQLHGDAPMAGIPGVVPLAARGSTSVWMVLPSCASAAATAPRAGALPAGLERLGRVPVSVPQPVRALARDADGGIVVLLDGTVVRLGPQGGPRDTLPRPSCDPADAVWWRGGVWVACRDGAIAEAGPGGWSTSSRTGPLAGLAAGARLWRWGESGLEASGDGRTWRREVGGEVRAAAARGETVAWSDGRRVWVREAGRVRELARPPGEVRALSWSGPNLWVLLPDGLASSGGGLLPWRRRLADAGPVAAVAGGEDGLWLVRTDGDLVAWRGGGCAGLVAFAPRGGFTGMAEPRGLALSPDGWFAVADTRDHRVVWFGLDGACLDVLGAEGTGPGSFREPSGLALGRDGTLAVADTWNGRVQLITGDGAIRVVGRDLYGPRGVAWDDAGTLYIADTGNRRVLRTAPPGWRLAEVARLEAPVVGLAWLGDRLAAAVPAQGVVALIDPDHGTVERTLEVPGWQGGEQQEGYVVRMPSGDLLVSAPGPGELWRLDPSGGREPVRVAAGLPGVTGLAMVGPTRVLAALTWQHRIERVALPGAR